MATHALSLSSPFTIPHIFRLDQQIADSNADRCARQGRHRRATTSLFNALQGGMGGGAINVDKLCKGEKSIGRSQKQIAKCGQEFAGLQAEYGPNVAELARWTRAFQS